MEAFNPESFVVILALVGVVIMVAALISGLIERSNLPQVAVFLALGAVLGPPGLGLINITLDSPTLRVVATLSLGLVLFTDAVGLNIKETRKHAHLALLVLGPGTMLSAALITLAGWWLLGLPVAAAVVVGAALASTDPVLLRGLLGRRDIPTAVRQALRLESGLNDVVLLPVVLVAMVFLSHTSPTEGINWGQMFLDLFLLGPGAGVAVGLLGVSTLDLVRRRIGVRRDYESLYSLGVAFAAFAAAEAVHGSGFLAAFAAGLTIAALDVELCDCFLEYGETTAEMALLFTFVLFGSSLIWTGFEVLTITILIFALLVLLIRPVAFLLALASTRLNRHERILISWFGPRGLSTLLLVLLPVFAGVQGSSYLFAICSLVVLFSVVVHGGSLMFLGRGRSKKLSPAVALSGAAGDEQAPSPPAPPAAQPLDGHPVAGEPIAFTPRLGARRPPGEEPDGAQHHDAPPPAHDGQRAGEQPESIVPDHERITIEEMQELESAGEPVVVVDARTERTYENDDLQAPGAARIVPGAGGLDIVAQAKELGLPRDAWLAIFCA